MKHLPIALVSLLGFALAQPAFTQTCEPSPTRHAHALHGEVMGKHNYLASVNDKIFWLESSQYGWDMRLRDKDKMDLSQITPPFHGPNPREIYGWHFRNADNTGKNTGDVNAPQLLRLFQFDPALSGTGGFRPSTGVVEPDPNQGRGALTIRDFGLTDLEPGQKARMNYLKFHVCLTWPKTEEEMTEEANAKSPVFLDAEKETMYGCGLDSKKYELSAWILPRWIGGDMDGDDAHDDIAPIIRKSDGKKGIAVCRAGSWLSVIGYGEGAKKQLKPVGDQPGFEGYYSLAQYLNKMGAWEMREDANTGNDLLILSQIEKSEVSIEWHDDKFTSYLGWHLVEP